MTFRTDSEDPGRLFGRDLCCLLYSDAVRPAEDNSGVIDFPVWLPHNGFKDKRSKPEMTEIGGRSAAVITGTVSNGPMHFYAFGSGRKAMILMLTGEEAVGYAETVIRSVEIH